MCSYHDPGCRYMPEGSFSLISLEHGIRMGKAEPCISALPLHFLVFQSCLIPHSDLSHSQQGFGARKLLLGAPRLGCLHGHLCCSLLLQVPAPGLGVLPLHIRAPLGVSPFASNYAINPFLSTLSLVPPLCPSSPCPKSYQIIFLLIKS